MKNAISDRGWEHNKAGILAMLYLIGKGESLKKRQWLWRGIIALPQPLVPKQQLQVAARANTTFLRLLAAEVPCAFIAQAVNSVSQWYHWLSPIGVQYVSEVDCKDQFNNIDPDDAHSHLSSASAWLSSRKRWRMQEITWSMHKESKQLYRAGLGNSTKFWFVTHEAMTDTLMFEMHHNNFLKAAGGLWRREGCIPMGGSFSAEAADLNSLWGCTQADTNSETWVNSTSQTRASHAGCVHRGKLHCVSSGMIY